MNLNSPVPIWLFLLVFLLLTGAFWSLVKTAFLAVIVSTVYLIRWSPIILGLIAAITVGSIFMNEQSFENQATKDHPAARQITFDRYHREGDTWIHGNFRHSNSWKKSMFDRVGTETVERID
jgi:hypothetical protein